MNVEDVPPDFPQEFLGAVSGAHPKLIVRKNDCGEFVSEAESQRADRWAICADLCEQLVHYVNKHTKEGEPREAFVAKVARAVDSKRAGWELSLAEAEWVKARLRALYP